MKTETEIRDRLELQKNTIKKLKPQHKAMFEDIFYNGVRALEWVLEDVQ